MRPKNLKTKIFLDGSDIQETKTILSLLGFLDGQTTNPSNFAKSPETVERVKRDGTFDLDALYQAYKLRVQQISKLLPDGSISIEVYADKSTTAPEMLKQAREFNGWIPNAYIKFPITAEGLKAAEQAVEEGIRLNMTLCFSQPQAAAVYAATKGAPVGGIFVSPFVGRWYDKGVAGMDLIKNILKMYEQGDGHVKVLTSSVRTSEQFQYALALGTDIITAYFDAIKDWGTAGMPIPDVGTFDNSEYQPIPYEDLSLDRPCLDYKIGHKMTDAGLEKFVSDWNALIK